jgi:hypothetical protein
MTLESHALPLRHGSDIRGRHERAQYDLKRKKLGPPHVPLVSKMW